jgi:septum formation protein
MLVLASRSPRRAEILQSAGIPFCIRLPEEVDETPLAGEPASEYVRRLAREKARATPREPGDVILGADTAVVVDGRILGKPAGPAEARTMLSALSGRRHEVLTGICLRADSEIVETAVTAVWFHSLSADDIDSYVASGEPMDKAGAYGIQGLASKFIVRIEGCYFNVVGLPVALVYQSLRSLVPPM